MNACAQHGRTCVLQTASLLETNAEHSRRTAISPAGELPTINGRHNTLLTSVKSPAGRGASWTFHFALSNGIVRKLAG